MKEKKSALIIGAGIGGLATSVYLAREGYNVNVYEKNSSPGGRCGQLIRDGHRFDIGATMLMMPGIYREVFDSLNIPLFANDDIKPLEDLYNIYFDNKEVLAFSPDEKKMKAQLERFETGSFIKAQEYVRTGYGIYQLGISRLINRNFNNFLQFANFKNINLLFRLKAYISHYRYIRRFFRNEHLRMAYTFQNIYVGQSPFNSPALFSMVPAAELKEGSFALTGGMFSVVQKLIDAATLAGVNFHYSTAVERIKVSSGKAKGIVLNNGSEIYADVIVANADLPYVYRSLLPDRRKSRQIDRMRFSCSAICFHWGLDKVYPLLGQHSVFLSDGFRKGLDAIFRQKAVSETPSFYVHAPSRNDPSAAPPQQDTLSVIVAASNIDRKTQQDWDHLKSRTKEAILKRLKEQGLTDIEEHIKFEVCYTPESWENACNISRGSVFGSLAHNILQMGYFRPHNRHRRYRNLFFTGGSTHPGNGIPNVLISAKLTSERILKDL